MKNLLLKIATPAKIRRGVSAALVVLRLIIDGLKGLVNGDNLTDQSRKNLGAILIAVHAVYDFLWRVGELIGVEASAQPKSLDELFKSSDELSRVTDQL